MEDIATLKQTLVTASRVMANEGLTKGFGHISVRIPGSERFLIPGHMSPALVRFENILTINLKGEKVEGQGTPNSETVIHTAVYCARPDVNAVAHTHSPKAVILSSAGQTLRPLTQAHMHFADGVPLYNTPGLIITDEQGEDVARTLGQHKAVLLRGHGAVVVGPELRKTCVLAVNLEDAAEAQFWTTLLGTPNYFTEEEIEALKARPAGLPAIQRAWNYYVSRLPAAA